jgi:organic hydroperoxide reductase OsmC/OhrA
MQPFPHQYFVDAAGAAAGDVVLQAPGLPALRSGLPSEFGGAGDRWSPEALLVGAVADCFILTFRAVARASKLPWTQVRCSAVGTLDRVEGVVRFTSFELAVALEVASGTSIGLARHSLEKAERACLITNSLKAPVVLRTEISTEAASTAVPA